MSKNTIKWRIFKYNISLIVILIISTMIIFNVSIHIYIYREVTSQLNKIATSAKGTALKHGPDFFPKNNHAPEDSDINNCTPPPPPPLDNKGSESDNFYPTFQSNNEIFKYYFLLDRSLKEPLTLLNSDFILINENKEVISPFNSKSLYSDIENKILKENSASINSKKETLLEFTLSHTKYISIIQPICDKDSSLLGWIIIYSNIGKIQQLQIYINCILLFILTFCAFITAIISSHISKKISEPFYELNSHIKSISERDFGSKIDIPVYDELNTFIKNINTMSEKLKNYDSSQKSFLENISHEFRTPLMSIQSYTEGIKYDVVKPIDAVDIILTEVKRLTSLVEDLLYLSRLNAIEENYQIIKLNFNDLIDDCINRMNLIASKNKISINFEAAKDDIFIDADSEKLSRAVTNILSNCIRFAKSTVSINMEVSDDNLILKICNDGPHFKDDEILKVFDRFYKGEKGNFGLGLSISQHIINKFNGSIEASNQPDGVLFTIILPI